MHIYEYAMRRANMPIRYECDMRYANTLCAARILYVICQYVMGRANAICDTRIPYGPRECGTWYANAVSGIRIRYSYGPREYDMRYANALRAARTRCAIREYAMGRANARYANRLYAMSNCKVAFSATIKSLYKLVTMQ